MCTFHFLQKNHKGVDIKTVEDFYVEDIHKLKYVPHSWTCVYIYGRILISN